MANFSWIKEEFTSAILSPTRQSSYVKLTRAEVARRSGITGSALVPALRKWAHATAVPVYAIAWSDEEGPEALIIISKQEPTGASG
jgi:hypothetical protein